MIEFTQVSKQYPGATSPALANVSLQIPPRKTTVLVGPSGCGKTTALRMINRMVEPTEGTVTIDGEDVAEKDPVQLRRSIGYVLQNGGLMPHHKVIDNIMAVPKLIGTPKNKAKDRAYELLDLVGLDEELALRFPAQLSGGQQQRVGVARALAADPNILLMDEPFAAIDPVVRAELQTEIRRLQKELNKTIVFVTHDIDEALLLGDQIALLQPGGSPAQVGTPEELFSNPANETVANFLGLNSRRRLRLAANSDVLIDASGQPRAILTERP